MVCVKTTRIKEFFLEEIERKTKEIWCKIIYEKQNEIPGLKYIYVKNQNKINEWLFCCRSETIEYGTQDSKFTTFSFH